MAGTPYELPDQLAPVLDFVNTLDIEDDTDALPDRTALTGWLADQGLLDGDGSATAADLRLALELRTTLRALALANNGVPVDGDDLERARRCFDLLPVVASPDGQALAPRGAKPVRQALARLVAGYATARAAGDWHRLRRCPAEDCGWVFWDSSPRAARRWCTMRVCGNRAKARAYAERQAR